MTRTLDARSADRALRRVAKLRTLFRRLPHLHTPKEERLLREFDAYAAGAPGPCSSEALRAGFLRAFRADAPAAILAAAQRAGPVVDEERDLWPYEAWAERRSLQSR